MQVLQPLFPVAGAQRAVAPGKDSSVQVREEHQRPVDADVDAQDVADLRPEAVAACRAAEARLRRGLLNPSFPGQLGDDRVHGLAGQRRRVADLSQSRWFGAAKNPQHGLHVQSAQQRGLAAGELVGLHRGLTSPRH